MVCSLPIILAAGYAHAAGGGGEASGHGSQAMVFLWIALILIAAKVSGLIAKLGQPTVLGELLVGVLLGNLGLLGFHYFEPLKHDSIIAFLGELGVIILLFQIGLESNIKQMARVGKPAFLVAIIGVVLPFVAGTYLIRPWLLPGLSSTAYLFLGATLTATSVGIMKLLDRINRTGTTVVMATHDRGIVDTMRRRVIELDRGRIVRDQARGVYE